MGGCQEIAGNHFTRLVGAHDEDRLRGLAGEVGAKFLADTPPNGAEAADEHDRGRPIEQDHAAANPGQPRDPPGGHDKTVECGEQKHGKRGCPKQRGEIAEGDPAPRQVAQAEGVKHHQLDCHHAEHCCGVDLQPVSIEREVAADEKGHKERGCKNDRMHCQQHQGAATHLPERHRGFGDRHVHDCFLCKSRAVPNQRLRVRSKRPG